MMHPTVTDIGRALRAARKAAGLSQRALSDRIGLTQAQISKFENGRADPRLSSLVEVARGVGRRGDAGAEGRRARRAGPGRSAGER